MNREPLIERYDATKRSEFRHAQLLRSLFTTTVKILEINNSRPSNTNLKSFLEANNIANGRSFDQSTLPPIDRYVNALPIEPYEGPHESNRVAEVSSGYQSELVRGDEDATSGPGAPTTEAGHGPGQPPSKEPAKRLLDGSTKEDLLAQERPRAEDLNKAQTRRLERSVEYTSSVANGDERKGPHPGPPQELSSSSDDGRPLAPPAAKGVAPESNGIQDQLDQAKDEQGAYTTDERQQNGDAITPLASAGGASPFPGVEARLTEENAPRPDGVSKSLVYTARGEALHGSPATPNEQLRLEEAQAMQISQDSGALLDGESSTEKILGGQSQHGRSVQGTNADLEDGETSVTPHFDDLNTEINGGHNDGTSAASHEQNDQLVSRTSGLRNTVFHGMNGESPEEITLSRRPPMQINTNVPSTSGATVTSEARPSAISLVNNTALSGSATPNKLAHTASSAQSPPERMSTRISSGTLRQKSISEILGETPKVTPTQADRGNFERGFSDSHREDQCSFQTPKSASSFTSPDPAVFKQRLSELKGKDRSKLSTVVFAPGPRNADNIQSQRTDDKETPVEDKDYFLTLFAAKGCHGLPSLSQLIKTAHKTLTTSELYTDFNERQACQVLNRIHELQTTHRWSLRQPERSVEPNRPVTHWDVLLSQMKWMRTDFREERKWKISSAKYLADICAYWVASSKEERESLRVRVRPVRARANSRSLSASTPDLVHSADDEVSEATDDECIREKDSPANAPAAIFSLPPEMFIFGLSKSPVAEKLLLELPLYQPNAEIQDAALGITQLQPDAVWKKPLVPTSKYVEGKIVPLLEEGPPRKRSRFDYSQEEGPRPNLGNMPDLTQALFERAVKPEQEDVALFDPENKHIRDRIHASHAFRPPSEYNMPSQSFFESRQSSQWTPEEDHELRRIVRDYAYNWSLISSCLTTPSMYHSQAERRTPWECFERWISLEGLPVEMAKIQYFRAYHSRLQAAQKTVEAQHQAIQQAHVNNPAQMPMRRRTTQPCSVERRKTVKHIHLIDAMRKLAKKRETALHKQQHVASLAAMRKAQEPAKQRTTMHTPADFSRLKHEKQMKLEEQQRQYRAQMLQHQRAAQAAKASQQAGQQSNGIQPVRNSAPGLPNGDMNAANVHGQLRGGGVDPARPVQIPRPNGQTNGVLPTSSHGVPHAPMQQNLQVQMQMQQRLPPNMASDTRMAQEVARVQAEQQYHQQLRQQRHAQSNGQSGSPPMQNPNLLPQNNPAILASLQGRSSPSINGIPNPAVSSTSPRMTQPQTLSSGMTPAVNQVHAHFKARHPQATQDQINRMTTDTLYKMTSNEARQYAMQAAAGNANANAVANNSGIGLQALSPVQQAALMTNGNNSMSASQQYAQFMRTQQASQSQRGGSAAAGQNGSRSATPLIQRTGSAQGGPRPSQSPSARQVGLAGGQ